MKNNQYDINYLFLLIKQYYVDNFPSPIGFSGVDVINHELNKLTNPRKVKSNSEGYYLSINPNFSFGGSRLDTELEKNLKNKENIGNIISDINDLNDWLVMAGYLYNVTGEFIASEQLLIKDRLTNETKN